MSAQKTEARSLDVQLNAFLAQDRRMALARGVELPAVADGAVLFADISGFTPLTEALAAKLGPSRGAEALTRLLNLVYAALIGEVERHGGSVIGFSGDAITCWFSSGDAGPSCASATAVACASALHTTMEQFAGAMVVDGVHAALSVKVAVASGAVMRCIVGDPAHQRIEVIAGATLDRMAAAEQTTHQGETIVDHVTAARLDLPPTNDAARTTPTGEQVFVWRSANASTHLTPPEDLPVLPRSITQPWLLPAVQERLVAGQGRFTAELRPATALFLHFAGIDFEQDADAAGQLDRFVRWVQQVISQYEGALIQLTTGDKGSYLYAAFGAPIAHDDDPLRAVAAAMQLRQPPADTAGKLVLRIGVSYGLMRVGPYGSANRLTYGVLGDATNMAARLMAQAPEGAVWLSEQAAAQVGVRYTLSLVGMRKFKGKEQPQAVYAVIGELTPSTAHLAALAAIPIIGRETEMARLRTAMQRALAEQSTLTRLVGEAGAGKSQMTSHFCVEAANAGVRILYTTCQSTQQHAAYAALRPIIRSLLHYTDSALASSEDQMTRLTALVAAANPAWLLRLPLLGDLLDLPIPDNRTTAAFDAGLRQEALTSLIIEIVQQAASDQPLALVIEDVHWLDEASQRIVLALAHGAPSSRLLLLLAHRPVHGEQPGFFRELAGLSQAETIELVELDTSGTRQLVRNRLQGDLGALALDVIYALGHGNPFFSEELVDALRESNRLVCEQGVWQLAPAVIEELRRANCLMRVDEAWRLRPEVPRTAVDLGLPTSLHGLVLARLDRLPEATKLTLKVASVIGRSFELAILAAAHPRKLTPASLTEHLVLAESRDFTRLETADSHLIYIFRHNITQEAVYQTLLEAQRQELHLYVAEAIEHQTPAAIDQLAYHYTQCDLTLPAVRGKALTYLDAAAKRAKHDHANETALAYFDRALLFEHRWDWLLGRAEALHVLGRRMQEEANLWVLYHFAGVSPAQQLETALHFADLYEATGNYDSAVAWTGRARKIALEYENPRGEAGCFIKSGVIAWRQGDYPAATAAYQSALAIARLDESLLDVEADAHYGLGLVLRQQSQFDEAQAQFDIDLEINRRLGNRYYEARALNALGALLSMQRRYAAAVELFQAALTIRESIGDRAGLAISLLSTAQAFASIGDYGKAEPILHRVIEIQRATNNAWDEMLTLNEFGILYMTVGAYESALRYLSTALERSQLINSDIGAAYILCNLGQVQRDCGRLDLAQETFRQGLELADAQQDENLAAIYHGDWALTALRAGDYAAACQHGEHALTIFQELKQPLSTPFVLATLAAANLAQGNTTIAIAKVHAAITLLDGSRGEAVDFPARDYWQCSQVLAQLGLRQEAAEAGRRAHELLMERAALISDTSMRKSFLTSVPVHAEIIAAGYRSSNGMNRPGVPSANTA